MININKFKLFLAILIFGSLYVFFRNACFSQFITKIGDVESGRDTNNNNVNGDQHNYYNKELSKPSQLPALSENNLQYFDDKGLIQRPIIINEIEEKFKETQINMIALIGEAGIGKTTATYLYAKKLNIPIIWQVDAAKGQLSILEDFYELALRACRSDEEIRDLKELREISNLDQREKRLSIIIKKLLRENKWLLIIDNVENFKHINNFSLQMQKHGIKVKSLF